MANYAGFTTLTPGKGRIKAVQEGPSDNIYLDCALEGSADYIVSGDRHLLDLETFRKIPIVSPAAFLKLFGQEEENM